MTGEQAERPENVLEMAHYALGSLCLWMSRASSVLGVLTDDEYATVTKRERDAANDPDDPTHETGAWVLGIYDRLRNPEKGGESA